MKIKRNVNGQEMEFALTSRELMDAYFEEEFDCAMEDISMLCEDDYDGVELTQEDMKQVAKKALHYLKNNDSYYEAYWDSVRMAVNDYMVTKQNN